MEDKLNILQELERISPFLAHREKINPYSVPENYFSSLPEKIKVEIFSSVSHLPNKAYLQVPKNYFSELPEKILLKIHQQEVSNELQRLSLPLAAILKQNPYNVPQNYFQQLPKTIHEQVKNQKKGKLISLPLRLKYAIAACMVLLAATGILYFTSKPGTVVSSNNISLETIHNLSDEEIQHYLESNVTGSDETEVMPVIQNIPIEDDDIQQWLNNFSNEEIKSYLEVHNTPGESLIKNI
jgi:hypothetical protein